MFCRPRRRPKREDPDDVEAGEHLPVAPAAPEGVEPKTASWWRRWFGRKKKQKHQAEDVTEEEASSSSATEKNVSTSQESEGKGEVQEASPTSDPVPAATEQQPETEDEDKDDEDVTDDSVSTSESEGKGEVQEASPTSDPAPAADEEQLESDDEDTTDDADDSGSTSEESEGEAGVREASPTSDPGPGSADEDDTDEEEVEDDTDDEEVEDDDEDDTDDEEVEDDTDDEEVEDDDEDDTDDEEVEDDTDDEEVEDDTDDEEVEDDDEDDDTDDEEVEDDTDDNEDDTDDNEDDNEDDDKDDDEDDTDDEEDEDDDTEESVGTSQESEGEAGEQEASPTSDPAPESEGQDTTHDAEDGVSTSQESEGKGEVQEATPTSDPAPESVDEDVTDDSVSTSEKLTSDPVPAADEQQLESEDEDVTDDSGSTSEESEGEAGVREASPTSEKIQLRKRLWWQRILFSLHEKKYPVSWQPTPAGYGGSAKVSGSSGHLSREELLCLGFPNLAQTCYLNSALQGLLTLDRFIQGFNEQEKVWGCHSPSKVMRGFAEVGLCRFTNKGAEKKRVLASFKRTVAEFNAEFQDDRQKDAHEFLSCVLNMLRSQALDLQMAAVDMGVSYTCPVDAHIAFQMLSTRTCGRCGAQSMREEDYINLSLDVVPGGSVSRSLQEYLKESRLGYRCQCGAEESTRQSSFITLPNVLILQLKRFSFSPSFKLRKVDSPVELTKELVLSPEFSFTDQARTHYSLVSIISHLGSTAHSGHYICDGAHRDASGDPTGRWLTYDDDRVSETTAASACRRRRKTAYLLIYERQR